MSSTSQARCAENIAVMALLGEVPVAPGRNKCPREPDAEATVRIMSLQTEKHLASTLGFLSSVKDDPNKVTAVCAQEMDSSLCVLIAANAQKVGVSPYLQRVKAGFDGIFDTLKAASTSPRDDLECQVFKAIIVMCRERILSRTRLHPKETKRSIQSFLQEACERICQIQGAQNNKAFRRGAADLIEKMNRYDQALLTNGLYAVWHDDTDLGEIVDGFYKLSQIPNLAKMLLDDLDRTKPKMDPSSRKCLLNNIEKLAQYRSSATRLVKIARACPAVRRASTLVVSLESSAFERTTGEGLSLEQTLERIAASNNTHFDIGEICESDESSRKSYKETIENTMVNSKIHAEIQLISHLDTHPARLPPRFIASSKDACYLCNAFIAFHGKYTISRCHGRIYSGWRLPATTPPDVQQKFNAKLEQMITGRVSQMMQNRVRRIDTPLESSLFSVAGSMDTLLTLPVAEMDGLQDSDSDDTVTQQKNWSSQSVRKQTRPYCVQQQMPENREHAMTERVSRRSQMWLFFRRTLCLC